VVSPYVTVAVCVPYTPAPQESCGTKEHVAPGPTFVLRQPSVTFGTDHVPLPLVEVIVRFNFAVVVPLVLATFVSVIALPLTLLLGAAEPMLSGEPDDVETLTLIGLQLPLTVSATVAPLVGSVYVAVPVAFAVPLSVVP
jgi:hypothetical protein